MHPFYFPTTTIIIDDETLLLESLQNNLGDEILCHCYSNALEALTNIEKQSKDTLQVEHFFSAHQNVHDLDAHDQGDMFLKVKSTYWFPILQHKQRFSETSIAVIDYNMPAMDGFELCRKLKHLPMKKIMLTGLASKELAVKAFNEKIIDSFILKQENDFIDKLRAEIRSLTNEYFNAKTMPLKLAFSLQETRFIADQNFQSLFLQIREQKNIVEYYINSQPPGILMFDGEGKPYMLVVYDNERIRAHYEIAEELQAPPELLTLIAHKKVLPLFPTSTGYYDIMHFRDWEKYVYPAITVNEQNGLYMAELRNADFVLEHLKDFQSFDEYRDNLHK